MTRPRRHSTRAARPRWVAGGFTLIELALAFFIIGLVLGGILYPLSAQVAQRQATESQQQLEEIRDALVGFAAANGYLPCPDTTGDGIADPAAPGTCPNAEGFLPWVTLGVGQSDIWGNRFRYRITPEFTNTPVSPCTLADGRVGLCDTGNITVRTRDPVTKTTQILASNVIAVIISHGKNGFGATSASGIAQPAPPAANVDETTNAGLAGTTFVSRSRIDSSGGCSDTLSPGVSPLCEFDDVVIWVEKHTLFNRMIAAGKLP